MIWSIDLGIKKQHAIVLAGHGYARRIEDWVYINQEIGQFIFRQEFEGQEVHIGCTQQHCHKTPCMYTSISISFIYASV